MDIRRFSADDAEFCFKTRSKALIRKFYGELNPEEVIACVNAYMPADYIRMAEEHPFFIGEQNHAPIFFFTLKRIDARTAELPLIYVDLACIGKGIGSTCIAYLEQWIAVNWPEVETLIVDTVVPGYNGAFYEKVGFRPLTETVCTFPDLDIKALRLIKKLNLPAAEHLGISRGVVTPQTAGN